MLFMWLGYCEKASNYNLYDFVANKGQGNYTKYARELGVPNGGQWCTTFMLWCMKQVGVSVVVFFLVMCYNSCIWWKEERI